MAQALGEPVGLAEDASRGAHSSATVIGRSFSFRLIAHVLSAIVYVVLLMSLRAFWSEELRVIRGVYVSFRLPGSGRLTRAANRP